MQGGIRNKQWELLISKLWRLFAYRCRRSRRCDSSWCSRGSRCWSPALDAIGACPMKQRAQCDASASSIRRSSRSQRYAGARRSPEDVFSRWKHCSQLTFCSAPALQRSACPAARPVASSSALHSHANGRVPRLGEKERRVQFSNEELLQNREIVTEKVVRKNHAANCRESQRTLVSSCLHSERKLELQKRQRCVRWC